MVKEKSIKATVASNRKAADYLLRALQLSQSQNASAVKKLVCLADAELEKAPFKKRVAS